MSRTIGIDLGTTFSALSYYDEVEKRVKTLDTEPRHGGSTLLRSFVYYEPVRGDDGEFVKHNVVVGESAYRVRIKDEKRTIEAIKRRIGDEWAHEIDGVTLTPVTVSADILKEISKKAGAQLGAIDRTVVTIPAYFGDTERYNTLEAAKQAGLPNPELLEEPAAAALAYGIEVPTTAPHHYLLVYDLGGGTFDVTLTHDRSVQLDDDSWDLKIDTLAKDGIRKLGGLDFDHRLEEHVREKARNELGIEIELPPTRLQEWVEQLKRDLSELETASIDITQIGDSIEVTRKEFEDATAEKLAETRNQTESVLREAEKALREQIDKEIEAAEQDGKTREDALASYEQALREKAGDSPETWKRMLELFPEDQRPTLEAAQAAPSEVILAYPRVLIDVLLCGGSTRMPMVSEMLTTVFGHEPVKHDNPDLLVTRGAAYYAHLKADGNVNVGGVERRMPEAISSILGTGIGIGVAAPHGMENCIVLKKGSKYDQYYETADPPKPGAEAPADLWWLSTVEAGQEAVELMFYEGDSSVIEECMHLGTIRMSFPPSSNPKEPIKLKLKCDTNGIVDGVAVHCSTGTETPIRIERRLDSSANQVRRLGPEER